mmetsp:Transcript_42178/g.97660  ORF Transcript_42178/g.97660 Transcript_42178/m.97660 type:complete len:328 (-) Transcript_42178:295-1278(-)
MLLTPSNATSFLGWDVTGDHELVLGKWVVTISSKAVLAFVLLASLLLTYLAMRWAAGNIIRAALTGFDRDALGTDILVNDADISFGLVHALKHCRIGFELLVKGFRIVNPHPFTEGYLVDVKTILIEVNLCSLCTSRAKRLEISRLRVLDVKAAIESEGPSCFMFPGKSNLKLVLEHLENRSGVENPGGNSLTKLPVTVALVLTLAISFSLLCVAEMPMIYLLLHLRHHTELLIVALPVLMGLAYMGANIVGFFVALLSKIFLKTAIELRDVKLDNVVVDLHGVLVDVAPVHYKDFTEEVGSYIADDALYLVMSSLLKTLWRSVSSA